MGYKVRGTKVESPYPVALTPGETRLVFALQRYFEPDKIIPDLYVEKVDWLTTRENDCRNFTLASHYQAQNGSSYAQIDCVAVGERGVFVFESKDYAGWVYGKGGQRNWTVVLDYGREKHQFYNPVRQNEMHKRAVKDFLDEEIPVHSIVVFGRETVLKDVTEIPDDTIVCAQGSLGAVLMKFPKVLSEKQIKQVMKDIKHHRIKPTTRLRQEHISDIQQEKTP